MRKRSTAIRFRAPLSRTTYETHTINGLFPNTHVHSHFQHTIYTHAIYTQYTHAHTHTHTHIHIHTYTVSEVWSWLGNTEYVCINFLGYLSLSRSKRYEPIPEPVPPAIEWHSTKPCVCVCVYMCLYVCVCVCVCVKTWQVWEMIPSQHTGCYECVVCVLHVHVVICVCAELWMCVCVSVCHWCANRIEIPLNYRFHLLRDQSFPLTLLQHPQLWSILCVCGHMIVITTQHAHATQKHTHIHTHTHTFTQTLHETTLIFYHINTNN